MGPGAACACALPASAHIKSAPKIGVDHRAKMNFCSLAVIPMNPTNLLRYESIL